MAKVFAAGGSEGHDMTKGPLDVSTNDETGVVKETIEAFWGVWPELNVNSESTEALVKKTAMVRWSGES